MRIKTITEDFDHIQKFDQQVNDALANGWELTARGSLPATPGQRNSRRLLYAEMTLPDPVEETAPREPMDVVREIYEICAGVPQAECQGGSCPLYDWCKNLSKCADPSDWEVPDKC